tara:strand:- start:182 stop:1618 length:1437 start_codon:yes stop_codon:yes gene_type:complete
VNRRTKIVATVGPASERSEKILALIKAGVNVFRLNLSHGDINNHINVANRIRRQAKKLNHQIGILADLQGPKIRITQFQNGYVDLKRGNNFTLNLELTNKMGNETGVGINYPPLLNFLESGDTLLLDDGRLQLKVKSVENMAIHCQVTIGGVLSSNKGINKLGGGLAAPALTKKDIADILALGKLKPDFVAVSFVLSEEDIHETRKRLKENNISPAIIAKIERAEVVADETIIDKILEHSDGIMVARGDLGVEVGDAALIGIQKHLIRRARQMNRVVITATQMMESMVNNPMPTRAEVFDVANAVLDGTDAVMLSAETAVGSHPIAVVAAMSTTCLGAERHPTATTSRYRVERQFHSAEESIAMAAIYAANHYSNVKCIVSLTESGRTPLLMSRLSSGLPIYALSQQSVTLRKLCLCRGVIPLYFNYNEQGEPELQQQILDFLGKYQEFSSGDHLLMTKGEIMGSPGNTNVLKILKLP